jgi:hypothetical protein
MMGNGGNGTEQKVRMRRKSQGGHESKDMEKKDCVFHVLTYTHNSRASHTGDALRLVVVPGREARERTTHVQ